MEFRRSFRNRFNVLRGKRMFVTSQTLVVYVPSVQRLNRECSSSPYSRIQSGWVFSMDGYRTVVIRRYVVSRVCRFLHPIHWFKLANRLSSASPTVSMTVLVVTGQQGQMIVNLSYGLQSRFARVWLSISRLDTKMLILDPNSNFRNYILILDIYSFSLDEWYLMSYILSTVRLMMDHSRLSGREKRWTCNGSDLSCWLVFPWAFLTIMRFGRPSEWYQSV